MPSGPSIRATEILSITTVSITTVSITTVSITTVSIVVFSIMTLPIIMLSVVYAECSFMLSVTNKPFSMSVIMLDDIMLSAAGTPP